VLRDISKVWLSLEACAELSFFLSWTWIGTWLEVLADSGFPMHELRLLMAKRHDQVVGLAVVGVPEQARLARPRRIFLNQSGYDAHTNIYIEYNGIMARTPDAADVRTACLSFLRKQWPRRRLRVQAATDEMVNAIATTARSWRLHRANDCPYADLSAAPPGADALQRFLATLSSNTRQQISRARRRAEQSGALIFEKAQTPETAADFLAEMIALHGAAWQSRKGMEGAFGSPLIRRFVAQLAQTGTANGTVELFRVRTGAQTIGILMNFVFRNEAYSYQSGFAYSADNRDKPGLLCHALAAADYLARGVRGYHFMAGQNRYKQSLSNASERLSWVETYPHELVARAEDTARTLWRWLRKMRTAPPQGGAS
jgi:hypothetical protein